MQNGTSAPTRDAKLQEIEKLCGSHLLHNSESLCNLLRYLAQKALDYPGIPVKEYEIATEVFHRPADFDPRLDSTVRVQTGRLRSKLTEYYAEEPGNGITLEIPKGSYSVMFHPKTADKRLAEHEFRVVEVAPAPKETPARKSLGVFYRVMITVIACGVAVIAARLYLEKPAPPPAAAYAFWHRFFDNGEAPLLVYSNAEFVGRPETGLRYFRPGDSTSDIIDHYTGVGEVIAIHELDKLSALFKLSPRVKRGRLISWDDARNSDIIFIGSPSENLSLREIPSAQDFEFEVMSGPPRRGDLAIVNLHPRSGEPPFFFSSPGRPITEDFAVIQLAPGLTAQHFVLILAGTTTLGTQAAVEYVCRVKKLEELLTRLTGSPSGDAPPFEAVIRAQISGGVPLQTQLVALHKR